MASNKLEEINNILQELYRKNLGIEASMVVKRGLQGVVVFPADFIEEISGLWEPIKDVMESILEIISQTSVYNIEKIYVEMLGYVMLFYVLGETDTALVIFFRRKEDAEMMEKITPILNELKLARDRILEIAKS